MGCRVAPRRFRRRGRSIAPSRSVSKTGGLKSSARRTRTDAGIPLVEESWLRRDTSIYGRLDLSYDGLTEPKLLEYNADTPTSLFESGIIQWIWLEELFPDLDQFNSIHEKLLDAFRSVRTELVFDVPLYFSCVKDHAEDFVTVSYMRDVALQSGIDARHLYIEEIGYNPESGKFCDLEGMEIGHMFKLYPWEWLLEDEFGRSITPSGIKLYEPAWKLAASSKGLLPITRKEKSGSRRRRLSKPAGFARTTCRRSPAQAPLPGV